DQHALLDLLGRCRERFDPQSSSPPSAPFDREPVRPSLELPRPLLRWFHRRPGDRSAPALPVSMQMTMPLHRAAIALFSACAVLLAGAWAGGAFAPALAQPAGPRRAGMPDGPPAQREATEIPVADALVVNGAPMQLSVSYTTDRPFQVVEFYAAAFRSRGLFPIGTGDARFGHVSVFDPADGLQRSVTALAEPSGLTLVLLAVSDPRRFAFVPAREPDAPYPIP